MKKIFLICASILFLSASCNFLSKQANSGIMKTTNGGADWQKANVIKDAKTGSLVFLNIMRLAFDPQNREIIFAATYTGGLFKSDNSGGSWTKILSKIVVYDVAVHPTDPKIIYASGIFGTAGKLLKTADGGKSWEEIYNEQSAQNPVRTVAINPESPNQVVIGLESGDIIKSADSGISWKFVDTFKSKIQRMYWQHGGLYILSKQFGLYKTSDFGTSFENISLGLTKIADIKKWNLMEQLDNVSNFNQFFIDPYSKNLIYLTSEQGLFKTVDEGKNWQKVALPIKSNETNVRAVAIARSSSNIVYVSVGNTIYKSVDGAQTFQTQSIQTPGFIYALLIDPELAQIAYAGIYTINN